MRASTIRLVCAASVALFAPGCFFTSPSMGERGVVELAYDEGLFGCIFGCDAREPMATDAHTNIIVTNDDEILADYGPFVVESSDPAIAQFTQDSVSDTGIHAESHGPGAAMMVFSVDGTGELIDRYEIAVQPIDQIELSSPEIMSRLLVMIGGSVGLGVNLTDADDRTLKGYGGVDYVLSGGLSEVEVTLTTALAEAIARLFVGSTRESATIDAIALGEGMIEITARRGGATLTIPTEVVDTTAVARIEVADVEAEPGTTTSLSVRAFDASGEEIHDPDCDAWTFAGTGVSSDGEGRGYISLTAATETTGTATCTLNGQMATGTVTFAMPEM
jgi:hypothetical protein